jgi:hypothetical protein
MRLSSFFPSSASAAFHRVFRICTALILFSALLAIPTYAATATTTILSLSSSQVAAGAKVTLTASVKSGSTALLHGYLIFYQGKSILGAAQIDDVASSPGYKTATLVRRFDAGSYELSTSFAGTSAYGKSASAQQALTVTGTNPTATTITASPGSPYTLTATVQGTGSTLVPSGVVSFVDATEANSVLGTASLVAGSAVSTLGFNDLTPADSGSLPNAIVVGDFNGDGLDDFALTDGDSMTILLSNGDGTFTAGQSYPVGNPNWNSQQYLVAGDFNQDGVIDIAAVSGQVFLGVGDGTFTTANTINVAPPNDAAGNEFVVTADFNGDGVPDLVFVSGFVQVALGNGDGTFTTLPISAECSTCAGAVVGDFNGDGILDLATANGDGTATILLGKGNGTFTNKTTVATGAGDLSIATADFNGDGILDLATANGADNTVSISLGQGDGTFVVKTTVPVGAGPAWVAVADFNGDGIADLTVANSQDNTESILVGKGDGTFTPLNSAQATGMTPVNTGIGDFNGDGVPDQAVVDYSGSGATVLLTKRMESSTAILDNVTVPSNGIQSIFASYVGGPYYGGSSSASVALSATRYPTSISVLIDRSTDGGGQPVVLTATLTPYLDTLSTTDGEAVSFYSNGNLLGTAKLVSGAATLSTQLPAGINSLTAVYGGDAGFMGSTSPAVSFAVNPAPAATSINLHLSSSTALPGAVLTLTANVARGGSAVTLGEVRFFDGKTVLGTVQIVNVGTAAGYGTATLKLRLGEGTHAVTAKFLGTAAYGASVSGGQTITVAGLYPTTTSLLIGSGSPPTFTATVTGRGTLFLPLTGSVAFENINDGSQVLERVDLDTSTAALNIASPATLPVSNPIGVSATADFNGDGIPDIAISTGSTVNVLLGAGDGTFVSKSVMNLAAYVMIAGDFNQDGIQDLAVADTTAGTVTILIGKGDGTFTALSSFSAGSSGPLPLYTPAGQFVTSDLNGDGVLDLVLMDANSFSLTILFGKGDGTFTVAPSPPTIGAQPSGIVVADFNGDGIPDIATANSFDVSLDDYTSANQDTVTMFLGDGDGTFRGPHVVSESGCGGTPGPFDMNLGPVSIAVGDLNGDGVPDLVTGNFMGYFVGAEYTIGDPTLTVLLGRGDGSFNVSFCQTGPSQPYNLLIADFNGDGVPDVAGNGIAGSGSTGVGIVLGKGDGTFTAGPSSSDGEGSPGAAVDLNGDGVPDLIFGDGKIFLVERTQTASASFSGPTPAGADVVAAYSGSTNFAASVSNNISLSSGLATKIQLGASPARSTEGETVQLTATLAPFQGSGDSTNGESVYFYSNSLLVGTAKLMSGVAMLSTSSLHEGITALTAVYEADQNFQASTSPAFSYTVVPVPTIATSVQLVADPQHSDEGEAVQLTATLYPSSSGAEMTNGETVSFYSNTLLLGTAKLTLGVAKLNTTALHLGITALTAVYQGDYHFIASASPAFPYTVHPAPVTTSEMGVPVK